MQPRASREPEAPTRKWGGIVRRLVESARALGGVVRQTLANLLSLFFERRYGIDTSTEVSLEELGLAHPERTPYIPAGWLTLRHILRRWNFSDEDVFLDLGSGKGRTVLFAAQGPFKGVIGVEISRDLHTIAKANIRRNMHRLKCKNIELVNSDVLDYDIPEDVTVAFLFNPFRGDIFISTIAKLLRSIDARPRTIRLI
jgi:SAM-dependent methyltransferase